MVVFPQDDLLELRKNLSTQEIVELARRHKSQGLSSSSSQPTNIKVCGACLGTHRSGEIMRGRREGGGDTGLRFKTGEFIGTKQYNSFSREI